MRFKLDEWRAAASSTPSRARPRVRVMFGSCSDVLPDQAANHEKIPAKPRADARIRTADPFITRDAAVRVVRSNFRTTEPNLNVAGDRR